MVWDVPRASDAMSVLNKEKVDAIVAAEGDRRLSLRGLCQRARRQNKDIQIFIRLLPDGGSDDLETALGLGFLALAHDQTPREILKHVQATLDGPGEPLEELSLDLLDPPGQSAAPAPLDPDALRPEPAAADLADSAPVAADTLAPEALEADSVLAEPLAADALVSDIPAAESLAFSDTDALAQLADLPEVEPAGSLQAQFADLPEPESVVPLEEEPLVVDAGNDGSDAEIESLEHSKETETVESGATSLPEAAPVGLPPENTEPSSADGDNPSETGPDGEAKLGDVSVADAEIPLPDTSQVPVAGLLMHLFFQEKTGRIDIAEPCPFRCIYLFKGDPAWMDYRGGDAELFAKMQDAGLLDAGLERPDVPEEQLLVALIGEKLLSQADAEAFMKSEVRRAVLEILREESLLASWEEVLEYAQLEPPFRYNAFGLVLECRRESMSADRLLAIANEKEHHFVVPQEGFQAAADRVSTFVRGAKISDWVTGEHTLGVLSEKTGLDVMIGTLVLCALEEAGVVRLTETPESGV